MPCIHNSIVMQGAATSQTALQGTRQGQHPAAPSRLAHASGPANVAAALSPSIAVEVALPVASEPAASMVAEPASAEAVEAALVVASEPAASMNAEPASTEAVEPAASMASEATCMANVEPASNVASQPAASIVTEPASMANVEPAPVVDSEPALPRADLAGGGAAEAACLVDGSAAEEEAKEATGLTPIVNRMVESTVRQGGPLCRETGLIAFVSGGILQPCATLVRLTDTLRLYLLHVCFLIVPMIHLQTQHCPEVPPIANVALP